MMGRCTTACTTNLAMRNDSSPLGRGAGQCRRIRSIKFDLRERESACVGAEKERSE